MSEKHEISQDVKIVICSRNWRVSSKLSEAFNPHGTITLTQHEIDSIYAYIHEDDDEELDPDDVKVADDEPSCRKCLYRRRCEVGPRSADVCTNYYSLVGELSNLLSQVTPGEWEPESAEVEKLVCGSCFYFDAIDDGLGDCYRYPPNSNTIVVEDCQRACGEHRLRE